MWRRPGVIGGLVGAVVVAIGAWAAFGRPKTSLADDPDSRRIAVLYFDDNSKDHSLRPLADGLTEGLIQSLGGSTTLTLISLSGVERFRDSQAPVDSIARALRAGYLVRGAVEPDGNEVRVDLRLDDKSGANLKRTSIAVPAGNTLRIRDSLALLASDLIRQQLGQDIQVREQRGDTRNEAAWLLVQRGLAAQRNAIVASAKGDAPAANAEFRAADSLFALSEKADPAWVVPVTQRAIQAYRRSRSVGGNTALIRQRIDEGLAHADRAIKLAPENPDALQVRGQLRYWGWLANIDMDGAKRAAAFAAAKADLEKATSIDKTQAGAWAELSHLYNNDREMSENDVVIAAQRALDADEFLSNANVVSYRQFIASYDLGQTDKAEQYCARLRQRFPADPRAVRCQLYALTQGQPTAADIPVAWRLADSLVVVEPAPTREREGLIARMIVAIVIAEASKSNPALADSARHVARASAGTPKIDATRELAFRGAFVYTILGDKDDAIRLLTDYIAANPGMAVSLGANPGWWFKSLADEPRFRRITGATR
jgi:serine/threonine-protein kinase